jgi:hypothetical protein
MKALNADPAGLRERRSRHPVLVPECQATGMVAVIRSLGRAGYPVHACSSRRDALGLSSRFAAHTAIHPEYASDEFVPWLRDYISRHEVAGIIPSEGFLLGIRSTYEDWAPFMPDANPLSVVERCLSKCSTQLVFDQHPDGRLRENLPRAAMLSRDGRQDLTDLAGWQFPLFVKSDAVWSNTGHASWVRRAADMDALNRIASEGLRTHRYLLVQEPVGGLKSSANFLLHDGEIIAESMCLAHHENPHTGGLTALRQLWWWEEMAADARRRLEALGWQGVAMFEYKWEPDTGRFWFIEINARYWGFLNMEVLAGKDFPRVQMDARLGHVERLLGPGPVGFRCRLLFPMDIGYLMSLLRDPAVGPGKKLRAVAESMVNSLDPRVHSDLWFPGDRGLYLRAMRSFIARLGRP